LPIRQLSQDFGGDFGAPAGLYRGGIDCTIKSAPGNTED